MAEDSKFENWVAKLRIKTTMCVRTFEEALKLFMAIENSNQYDGVSFLMTFKPKVITYNNKKFLQAKLHQTPDLIMGLYFPFNVAEAYLSCGDMPFQKIPLTQSGEFYQFPTPFKVPSRKRTKIIVRFDDEIHPQYYHTIPFTIKVGLLAHKKLDEMLTLPEQHVNWNATFCLDLIPLVDGQKWVYDPLFPQCEKSNFKPRFTDKPATAEEHTFSLVESMDNYHT